MHALIDGHNALFRLGITGATAEAARRALLTRVAAVSRDVTVFFDAQGAPAGAPAIDRDLGLPVRYCRGHEADQAILEAVRAAPRAGDLVVVSDDRELTGRARQLGARSSGVSEWLAQGAPSEGLPPRPPTPAGGPPLTAADFGLPPVIDLAAPPGWIGPPADAAPSRAAAATRKATPDEARARELVQRIAAARPTRHVLLCADPTKPKCAPADQGREVWEHVKGRTKELGLDAVKPPEGGPGPGCILRTKVDCLRVCADGPICVVYPDGIWYRGVTVEVMERILVEHVLGGRPVLEHVLGRAPLERRS